VSLRPVGQKEFGTKVEIKNMNSFRAIHRASSTRSDARRKSRRRRPAGAGDAGLERCRGLTVSQRTKEFAEDIATFPEPDLPPLEVSREWVAEIRSQLPELPAARRERLIADLGLSPYDASVLTASQPMAEYFEATVRAGRARESGGQLAPG